MEKKECFVPKKAIFLPLFLKIAFFSLDKIKKCAFFEKILC
jgi:hypothetical protein